MKKNLFSLLFVVSLLSNVHTTNAQLNNCIATDFTLTDINGNTWNLYSILAQGKTVFIDFSTTMCIPCWNYHLSGALENLYTQYGPSGTDEVMVFLIESDASTNTACLYNLPGCTGGTLGDWVTGTPYPIIDNAAVVNSFIYQVDYYPAVLMITPDHISHINGELTTAQHYAAMQQYEVPPVTGNDAAINWGCQMNYYAGGCPGQVSLDVRLFNYASNPLTSATIELSVNNVVQQTIPWTGNLMFNDYTILHIIGITGNGGYNTAFLKVTSANGSPDSRPVNDTTSIPFFIHDTGGPPVMENFSGPISIFPPIMWTITNGGSQNTWTYSTAGYNGPGSAKMEFFNSPPGDVDVLSLPEIDFTGYTSASLTFDKSHKQSAAGVDDNLTIKVSTDCGATWTNIFSQTGAVLATVSGYTGNAPWFPSLPSDWAPVNIPLTSYVGNGIVLINFEATSGNGNNLYLDNVNVNLVTGTETVSSPNGFKLFPNPSPGTVTLQMRLTKASDITVNILNTIGQVVETIEKNNLSPAEYSFSINTVNLGPGIYNVNIISADGASTAKLVIE